MSVSNAWGQGLRIGGGGTWEKLQLPLELKPKITPRSILEEHQCDECCTEIWKKPFGLSDGRVFESGAEAEEVLGVTKEIVNTAIR
jgi:hypothetical protein